MTPITLTSSQNVAQKLWQVYQETPDQLAVTLLFNREPALQLNYRELVQRSTGYAQALADHSVQPGEVVILILQHGVELVAAFWGTVLYGAVPSIMPFLTEKLLPDHYREALEALFSICEPTTVITYNAFQPEVEKAARSAPSIRTILVSENIQTVENISAERLPGLHRPDEALVLLQHSSGTTGLQKGVALSHRAIFNQLSSYSRALQLVPDDVVVSWLPLYHDMGLIAGFILPILSGLHLVLMSPFDWVRAPVKLMQAINTYHGTLCWLPNFAYNFCAQKIRERDLEQVNLSSLRAVINCSEPMHWESHRLFLERFQPYGLLPDALATCYAMAENVFAVTQGGIDAPVTVDLIDAAVFTKQQMALPIFGTQKGETSQSLKMLSAGRPIDHTAVRVVDNHGADLPERHVGEIALQSDCMLSGYYKRPDLTEKAFLEGWYLTGDLGYLAGGELYVTGRKKDLIIVGGKNIYPQDIERLASEVEGVHPGRVVAFGVYNTQSGTEDAVLIAELDDLADRSQDDLDKISQQIRLRVSQGSDISLRQIELVERNWLVKTSSGKIARSANRDKFLQIIG